MDNLNARAQVYSLLAEFFKEPVESFYQALADGQVDAELKDCFRRLNCPLQSEFSRWNAASGDFAQFKEQYQRVFCGPSVPFYPPVESLYRVWTEDNTAQVPWAKEKGHYYSDGALHILAICETMGLTIPEEFRYKPDHLALELEIVSLLAMHAKDEDRRRFLQDHFIWLKELALDLDGLHQGRFLSQVVLFVEQFITWDRLTPNCA